MTAVNTPPTVNVPGPQVIGVNRPLVFSSVNVNAFTVGDVDADGAAEQITITATNGTVSLSTRQNLGFSAGSGSGDSTATFTGTLAALNAALDGLTFTPTPGYAGHGSIALAVDDLGHTGAGTAQTASASVPITIGGAGISVTPGSISVTDAGGSSTVSIILDSQPTADVTLSLASSDPTLATLSAGALTFTPSDWNVAQTVTITGAVTHVQQGNHNFQITFSPANSSDRNYSGLQLANLPATDVDVNSAGILVTPTRGLTTTVDGGTATFTLALTSQPTADVTIPLASSNANEGVPSTGSVTFTSQNWNTPQTVTLTGVNDHIADGDGAYSILTGPAVSADGSYNGFKPSDVSLTNIDTRNTAGIIVTPTTPLTTTALGGTASFTVALGSQPVADVLIPLTVSNPLDGTTSVMALRFTASNWNVAQSVTVTGRNDGLSGGVARYSITTGPAISADGSYGGMAVAPLIVTNIHDIAPQVLPADGPLDYLHEEDIVAVEPQLTINPPTTGALGGAQITLGGYVASEDRIGFNPVGNIAGAWNAATGVLTLGGIASAADYQEVLRSITYQNAADTPTPGDRAISFSISDGTLATTFSRLIDVDPINRGPVVAQPGPILAAAVNSDIVLSTAARNAFSVFDPDSQAVGAPVQITITAHSGTISLAATDGLTFAMGTGNDDATVVFNGSLASVNAAFNGMRFRPTPGFSGEATVDVAADDLGFGGVGGARMGRATLHIHIGTGSSAVAADVFTSLPAETRTDPPQQVPALPTTDEPAHVTVSTAAGEGRLTSGARSANKHYAMAQALTGQDHSSATRRVSARNAIANLADLLNEANRGRVFGGQQLIALPAQGDGENVITDPIVKPIVGPRRRCLPPGPRKRRRPNWPARPSGSVSMRLTSRWTPSRTRPK